MPKLYNGYIPYYSDGTPFTYISSGYQYPDPLNNGSSWKYNIPFPANLRLTDMERGRSAAHFIWEDEQGHAFIMFMTDLLDLIQNFTIENGVVSGMWGFVKRGQNFGVVYLGVALQQGEN